jgi:hypothetical protein
MNLLAAITQAGHIALWGSIILFLLYITYELHRGGHIRLRKNLNLPTDAGGTASMPEQETRSMEDLLKEIAALRESERKAVEFATRIERGEITFAKLVNQEIKIIADLPLGKGIHENLSDAVKRVLAERDDLKKRVKALNEACESHESVGEKIIRERDEAEEIIDRLCALAGHRNGFEFEWSSNYGFEDAVLDVGDKIDAMRQGREAAEALVVEQKGASEKLAHIVASLGLAEAHRHAHGEPSGWPLSNPALKSALDDVITVLAKTPAEMTSGLSALRKEISQARRAWLGDDYGHLPLIEAMEKFRVDHDAELERLRTQYEAVVGENEAQRGRTIDVLRQRDALMAAGSPIHSFAVVFIQTAPAGFLMAAKKLKPLLAQWEAAVAGVPNLEQFNRESLGRLVREVWIEWAKEQPNPKPSWLLPWDELSEPDREVDRRIGEHLAAVRCDFSYELNRLRKLASKWEGFAAHLDAESLQRYNANLTELTTLRGIVRMAYLNVLDGINPRSDAPRLTIEQQRQLGRDLATYGRLGMQMDNTPPIESFELVTHLCEQRNFSLETFGPGEKTAAVLAHIRKELDEIEANPSDLVEWIDVVLLAFDGALRHGGTPESVARALGEKFARNKRRQWPDWRTQPADQPIEHVSTESDPRSAQLTVAKEMWVKLRTELLDLCKLVIDNEHHEAIAEQPSLWQAEQVRSYIYAMQAEQKRLEFLIATKATVWRTEAGGYYLELNTELTSIWQEGRFSTSRAAIDNMMLAHPVT